MGRNTANGKKKPPSIGRAAYILYICAMNLLDGNLVSKSTKEELAIKVAQLIAAGRKVPHLAAVLVGSNGASETYVASKVKTCHEIGYKSTLIRLEDDISEHQLLSVIQDLTMTRMLMESSFSCHCQNIFPISRL